MTSLPRDDKPESTQSPETCIIDPTTQGDSVSIESPLPFKLGEMFMGKRLLHVRPMGESHFTSCLLEEGDSIHWKILRVNQLWGKLKRREI